MKNILYKITFVISVLLITNCTVEKYELGELNAPSNVAVAVTIAGKTTAAPNGDGSGDVTFTISGDNILASKIDFDANNALDLVAVNNGKITKKYTTLGLNTYTVTVIAYGPGGTSTTVTTEVTVKSDFTPNPAIVTALTNNTSKTWVVDKSVPGHFGVGPWTGSVGPDWWSANVDEKVSCCNCFYTSTFTFTKASATSYTIQVACPDGAFTKTGALTTLPGIPSSGAEGCYSYGGGSGAFSFIPSSTGIAAATPSTQTSILLSGVDTFIGYGALQKEYEILVINANYMYLRVQGTETGNAWYLKLKPAP
ncbi:MULTISPECIES: hypothetical protein [Flavobacterium]|uniref:Cadherin domain-containing protein n=1 Tax=Flavobacterium keumense TaxID=1306518 RepID=A0ABY8N7I6_9FLAO|nr:MULTISPECIES: hypothetical protein [Flavobacterium]WGK95619.1 hypothetical protein MG292_05175 [Flavobacterium keumense]